MDIKLYLPKFVRDYREIKETMEAEQPSVDEAWEDVGKVMNDQFVDTATESGIARYEKILGIKPKATHTLDERRFNILTKMNEQLPFTMETLENTLLQLCGKDGCSLFLNENAYALTVKLALTNENNIQAVTDMLNRMLPANMVKSVVMFNTHLVLAQHTHGQLANYTYKDVREELI